MGSLGFRYALTGYYTRLEYIEIVNRLKDTFGEPNRRHQFSGINRYGLYIRDGIQPSKWFAGPRRWTSPPGKNRDLYTFAFRTDRDRILASMMI